MAVRPAEVREGDAGGHHWRADRHGLRCATSSAFEALILHGLAMFSDEDPAATSGSAGYRTGRLPKADGSHFSGRRLRHARRHRQALLDANTWLTITGLI